MQQAVATGLPRAPASPTVASWGPLASTSAAPGLPVAASPCLGPAAAAGSGAPPEPRASRCRSHCHHSRNIRRGQGSGHRQHQGTKHRKGTPQSPVFEGDSNSRMLHFLTTVVGSTCDVKVKNGTTCEGMFTTLSSKFELAVDTVHQKASEPAGGPCQEDIVDTMVFESSDVVLVHFQLKC
ncbi:hypothetical protein J1605_010198 [Eschrichtius robustus]|uniref:Ataxin 2 SM domain-containing protein n=1 Tax=Eschrichtius robustus TaxID=9764 RepID=A0AB34GVH2_ESCRO|nr:hypothetical protein J1605_010198 [Eschrichtius robustus]